jgi:hypothetical protein
MDRKQLATIVDTVLAAWQVDTRDVKTVYRTWHRYLADVDFAAALAAVDAAVVTGERWAPRVGEIRRAAIDATDPAPAWPTADAAWAIAEARLRAVHSGVSMPSHGEVVDAAVARAMAAAVTTDSFHRQAFFDAWAVETRAREIARYGLGDDAPGVEA